MNPAELQSLMIKAIARPRVDKRIHYEFLTKLIEGVYQGEKSEFPNTQELYAAMWTLIGQGLVYLNMSQPVPTDWTIGLTSAGRAAVEGRKYNPYDPTEYLKRLESETSLSEAVSRYVSEALQAFNQRLYLSTAVMIGVAAEAAFIELSEAFCSSLPEKENKIFRSILDKERSSYSYKFEEFRKRFETKKPQLPPRLTENIDIFLNSTLDLLRLQRNDAAHPTHEETSKDTCRTLLEMFGFHAKRLYALKRHFLSHNLR